MTACCFSCLFCVPSESLQLPADAVVNNNQDYLLLKLLKAPATKPPDFQETSPIKIVINKIF